MGAAGAGPPPPGYAREGAPAGRVHDEWGAWEGWGRLLHWAPQMGTKRIQGGGGGVPWGAVLQAHTLRRLAARALRRARQSRGATVGAATGARRPARQVGEAGRGGLVVMLCFGGGAKQRVAE